MRLCFGFALMLAFLVNAQVWSKDDNPAYTDPEKAGRDFEIQGEYAGDAADGNRWGAQIIADGDGKFTAIGYPGGLPGDGWSRGDDSGTVKGKWDGDEVLFEAEEFILRVKDGKVNVESFSGEPYGTLKKVERKGDTLGKKPPAGAKVLFDGSSVENLTNGKIIEGNLLGATNVESKDKLGDHHLHIEFRQPFLPKSRGQARGHSGVYV